MENQIIGNPYASYGEFKQSMDQELQKKAEEALAWIFENKVKAGSKAQAAIVVMSSDGAVKPLCAQIFSACSSASRDMSTETADDAPPLSAAKVKPPV